MECVSFSSTRRGAAAVALALALAGCGISAPTPIITPTPVVTATPTTEATPTAAATASPTPTPAPSFLIYYVKKTDVLGLSGIAAKFNVILDDLIAANPNLKPPYYMWENMQLNIPPIGWHAPTPGPS
jgi:LysM repeat protein